MLHFFRNSLLFRIISVYLISSMIWQIVHPAAAYALTSGPTMPEYEQFAPPNISNLVDPSTGDLAYAVSLFNLEGHDVSLTYTGMNSMEEEATPFGWGWNFTPGTLMRQKRGLPDEFNGEDDKIKKSFYMKPNRTYGLRQGLGVQVAGIDANSFNIGVGLSASRGVFYNNYRGLGTEFSISPSLTAGGKSDGPLTASMGLQTSFSFNSQSGIGVDPSLSFSVQRSSGKQIENNVYKTTTGKYGLGISASYNSRVGLKSMGLNLSYERSNNYTSLFSKKSTGSMSAGSGALSGTLASFATPSYTPQLNLSFENLSISLSATVGSEVVPAHPHGSFSGYYTEQKLSKTSDEIPAYGYFHQENTVDKTHALLDFNREKDGIFIDGTSQHLALPFATYDLYTATGQAGVGMYHAQRSDRGIYFDDDMQSISRDGALGVEAGIGVGVHVGGSVRYVNTTSSSGKWVGHNELAQKFRYKSKAESDPDFEPYYFKQFGETPVESDPLFLGNIGGSKPVQVVLKNQGEVWATNQFRDNEGTPTPVGVIDYHRTSRAKRTQGMFMLNAEEASLVGLDKKIPTYKLDPSSNPVLSSVSAPEERVSSFRDKHDPSEFTVINDGGMRSVYGLPVYNTIEKSVSFAAGPDMRPPSIAEEDLVIDCEAGEVIYNSGVDNVNSEGSNSVGNQRGIDHYFSSEEIPAYSYAHLLTAILSPDYVDVTGDGITDDDLGTAYQFHYEKLHDDFKWRTPYGENRASHMEGYRTKIHDDKASYSYGEKEAYQLIAISSENLRLEFYYSDRKDGHGVLDEDGGIDASKSLQKVDRIELYNKKDREENGASAELLKTAHFKYNYELCKGVPNNSDTSSDSNEKGKLTLKKVWFTYGKSKRAKFNPYEFFYADPDHDGIIDEVFNPDYEEKAQDRWGSYKPNGCDADNIPNWEFPYTSQEVIPDTDTDYYDSDYPDRRYSDIYLQAWRLTGVKTPSGTHLNIDYEADQIAYVEDKIAGQMTKVLGFWEDPDYTKATYKLYKKEGIGNYTNYNHVFVQLQSSVADRDEFYRRYLKGINYLYFNFDVDITGNGDFERVPGYVKIKDYGISTGANSDVGWIEVELQAMKDKGKGPFANPFARQSWDFARANMSEYIFPGSSPMGTGEGAIMALLGFWMDLKTIFQGYNKAMRSKGFAKTVLPARSWLRLNSPDGMKRGGGIRVKKISYNDNWNAMGGGITATYGQEYDYTTTNEYGETISSGVASYEPLMGGDEIPHRQPHYLPPVNNKSSLDDIYYDEMPFGESQYPGPSIKYSEVTVRSISYEDDFNNKVSQNGVGYTKHKFYTAKDFPTIVEKTRLDVHYKKPNPILRFFQVGIKQYTTASQGYAVTLNNMHGVVKSVAQYAEGQENWVSKTEYTYKATDYRKTQKLVNEDIQVIHPNGLTGTATLGMEVDFSVDSREQQTITSGFDIQGNLDAFPPIIFIPVIIPMSIDEVKRFRSITTFKVIRRKGILDKIVDRDGGARTTTHNLAYDSETGAMLVSKSSNDYDDDVYSYNLPAHWAYDEGMGQAYKNTGAEWTNVELDNITDADQYFVKGDELLLTKAHPKPALRTSEKGWVLGIIGADEIVVVNDLGELIDDVLYSRVKIIRSGRRNTPGVGMASVVTQDNPITTGLDNSTNVLAAGAVEYSDKWNMLCGPPLTEPVCNCTELTPEAVDLQALLNALIANGELDNSQVDLSTYPVFSGSSLEAALFPSGVSSGCNPQYQSIENAPVGVCEGALEIDFGENCSGFTSSCNIILTPDAPHPFCMSYFSEFTNIRPVIDDPSQCVSSTKFQIDGIIAYNCNLGTDDVITFTGDMSCFPIRSCTEVMQPAGYCGEEGAVLNPYTTGIRGNWSAKKSYTYLTHRGPVSPSPTTTTDIRREGVFQNFNSFWQHISGAWTPDPTNWTWTAEATKRIPQGFDVESKDPLGRYSSSLYGYNLRLPIAVAGNARYNEIANANFELPEDYQLSCETHINLDGLDMVTNRSHTGFSSAKIEGGNEMNLIALVSDIDCTVEPDDVPLTIKEPYTLKECDCVKAFSPTEDKRYALSYWVQGEQYHTSPLAVYEYLNAEVEVKLNGMVLTIIDEQKSKLIEGWQRREIVFDLPAGSDGQALEIKFKNSGITGNHIYIDDLRVHPFYGGMQSYVYDPLNYQLMAALDERGFATFYVYDGQNQLMGIKQETEEGILSVSNQKGFVVPRLNQ